ncbi:hypothetical protein JX265_002027 [Neoarthrinium moseri]|uniref:Uncharacterized protein n=1 Tax=Neoarthrinium moseri TaxID=1658444 RepID=A0A9P9WWP9_9PEZI|nr:hypothetical protein JX265_002027 [Neoarthrinium moseri]
MRVVNALLTLLASAALTTLSHGALVDSESPNVIAAAAKGGKGGGRGGGNRGDKPKPKPTTKDLRPSTKNSPTTKASTTSKAKDTSKVTSITVTTSKPTITTSTKLNSGTTSKTDSKTASGTTSKTDSGTASRTDSKTESKANSKTISETDSRTISKTGSQIATTTDSKANPHTISTTDPLKSESLTASRTEPVTGSSTGSQTASKIQSITDSATSSLVTSKAGSATDSAPGLETASKTESDNDLATSSQIISETGSIVNSATSSQTGSETGSITGSATSSQRTSETVSVTNSASDPETTSETDWSAITSLAGDILTFSTQSATSSVNDATSTDSGVPPTQTSSDELDDQIKQFCGPLKTAKRGWRSSRRDGIPVVPDETGGGVTGVRLYTENLVACTGILIFGEHSKGVYSEILTHTVTIESSWKLKGLPDTKAYWDRATFKEGTVKAVMNIPDLEGGESTWPDETEFTQAHVDRMKSVLETIKKDIADLTGQDPIEVTHNMKAARIKEPDAGTLSIEADGTTVLAEGQQVELP